ncbi:hypothetical protein BHM03_00018639 [Ensete ventricosum]|nr:hypothetical protein BHM03_00018639 [Ensete ventricosum]
MLRPRSDLVCPRRLPLFAGSIHFTLASIFLKSSPIARPMLTTQSRPAYGRGVVGRWGQGNRPGPARAWNGIPRFEFEARGARTSLSGRPLSLLSPLSSLPPSLAWVRVSVLFQFGRRRLREENIEPSKAGRDPCEDRVL